MISIHKRMKIMCSILIVVMVLGSGIYSSSVIAYAETAKDQYIVVTDDVNALKDYALIDETLTDQNGKSIVTVELSKDQADALEKDVDIQTIEKDFTIESEKSVMENMVKPTEPDWARGAINLTASSSSAAIKVAVLDSGIDVTDNIQVAERKNFIEDMPVETPLFEDTCGHGTSVASIICGTGTDSDVVGVNSNIQLYSARVLDENKQAPISRIVKAINWAIEQDVDIINISFGTKTYSEALKAAIDKAVNNDILVVAAAGNDGNGGVDYPAAFDNVLAVGAVNAKEQVSDFSATGDQIDVVAPGEAVQAQGNFGEDLIMAGTSLSAPYVTGIASLLWSRDVSRNSDFISTLIKLSAKPLNNPLNSGHGLVDYTYALQIYDEVAKQYDELKKKSVVEEVEPGQIEDNPADTSENTKASSSGNELSIIDKIKSTQNGNLALDAVTEENIASKIDVVQNEAIIKDYSDPMVDGSWIAAQHKDFEGNVAMKEGAVYFDTSASGVAGMGKNPIFHGYSWGSGDIISLGLGSHNYMAAYNYLVKVAKAYKSGNTYKAVTKADVPGIGSDYTLLQNQVIHIKDNWDYTTASNKHSFLMGCAMHVASDAIAHSSFEKNGSAWERITHPQADSPSGNRWKFAKAIINTVVARKNGSRDGIKNFCHDFHPSFTYSSSSLGFRTANFKRFASLAGVSDSSILSDFAKIQTPS